MRNYRVIIYAFFCLSVFPIINISEGNIRDTKHNLSATGPGSIKESASGVGEICIFCHTPHRARTDVTYLWNRKASTVTYIPYQSSTLYAAVGQPTGASKMCLSCHDGTIALGALFNQQQEVPFEGGIRFIPEGPARLGTDLSDDHPVSFVYDSSLAASNVEIIDPANLPPEIRLDGNEQMQCTSCHDPHDDSNGKFLVLPNNFSNLCIRCHDKNGWDFASHALSTAIWNGAGTDPWQHTAYTSVAENGCENCHQPHTAGGHERLLNYAFEEDNCLVCHNGNVASTNIETQLTKLYIHPVQDYFDIHDPVEDFTFLTVEKHVECTDCHNPHMVNANLSPGAPQVSGALEGVKGIDDSGNQITNSLNQYEICFKCHADNNVIYTLPVDRQIQQLNTRLEFDSLNPSYHPIKAIGINADVPSLLPPYTTTSMIFCTDCHNNDDPIGPRGPHGSNIEHLLNGNYTTFDYTVENPSTYELCYNCHDRDSIMANESFAKHKKHIKKIDAPCSACHDPHGISHTQGNSTNNSHLINFDITIVQPDSQGRLYFEDLGTYTGKCFLNCHGVAHEPNVYP